MGTSVKPTVSVAPFASSRRPDAATLLHALSPLVWLPQAALLAWAVGGLQQGKDWQAMLLPAAGLALLALLRAGLEAWSGSRMYDAARDGLRQWRQQASAALAARSPLDRERISAGAAASILGEQAEAILPWLTRYRSAFWRVRLVPLFILAPVAWYSWVAACILLLAAPLIPVFMAIVGWRAKAASEAQWLQLSDMNGFLLDRLRGLRTLRSLGAVELTARRLGETAQELRRRTMIVLRIAFLSSAVLELFAALGVALVAVYVGFYLLGHLNFGAWGQRLSLAEGLFVLLLAPAFFEPLRELAAVWHDRAAGEAAMAAMKRLDADGLQLPEGERATQGHAVSSADTDTNTGKGPAVVVSGLHFAFPGEASLFSNVALSIAPGEKVALVGDSGSGKTALLALMAGLVSPNKGSIDIDGKNMTPEHWHAHRGRMGWMGQHPHVFAGSVDRNVALGRPGLTRSQVAESLDAVQLADVTQAHPSVALSEGGDGLSGGELARLALARLAVSSQTDLWFLDEPTAHLDSNTASLLRGRLMSLAGNRTVVVATHDALLAAQMDRIIHVDQLFKGSAQ